MSDNDIHAKVRDSVLRRPKYRRLVKYIPVVIAIAEVLAVGLLVQVAQVKLYLSLLITVGVFLAIFPFFILVWVNKVLFRITQEDATGSCNQPEDSPDAAAPRPPPVNVDDDDERAPDE